MPASAPRTRRTWFQRAVIAGNCVAIMVFLSAAVVLSYGYSKWTRLPRVELADVLGRAEVEDATGEAENFLLVGVDSADNLDPDDPVRSTRTAGGIRTDTMMLLRVDPAGGRAALLSLPRDLWVPLSTGGNGRINTAVAIGGPGALIDTIQEYLGIPVHHYVQVDFHGFGRIVDALGGVPVAFPHPVRDVKSGLHVPEAGCVVLDAANALGFVRSRAYQEFIDGRWRTDPTGDLGRIRRQQEFILTALHRAFAQGARNPVTLDALIDGTLDAVAVDDTLNGDDVVSLARQFRSFSPDELHIHEIPVSDAVIGGAEVLRLDSRRAEPTIALFRGVDPAALDEGAVRVRVLNGTGTPGEAAEVGDDLRAAGFSLAETGDAAELGVRYTEVRYGDGQRPAAELVERWMTGPARLVADDDTVEVTVVTGGDYRGVRSAPRPPPSTTTTLPTTTTSTTPDGPTTTVLGTIPVDAGTATGCT